MPVFTTEGIIIKRKNFGEADRILTVMTPYRGKISVLAKGVRRITSRRAGNVELLNKTRLHIFQGQGMRILSEAEAIQTYPKIKSDLILSSYGSHILELIDRLIPEEQVNPGAYQLLAASLSILEKNPRQIFIRAFEVKILREMGFWSFDFAQDLREIREVKGILEKLEKGSWGEIGELEIRQEEALELERIMRYYIEKVLEGSLKSVRLIEKLKNQH